MRKKAEIFAGLLTLAFIAAVTVLSLLPEPERIRTEQYAAPEAVLVGADDAPVAELMPGERVNINTADSARLQLLPGVGEATADSIIAYREEHGGFRKAEDIMNVSGIGEKKFGQIKDLITA